MEHKKRTTKKQRTIRDLQSIKTGIASLAHELWVEKSKTLNPAEVEWLVDGRLIGQLDELSKQELFRVERLLQRTVKRIGRKYMTGSPA